MERIYVVRSGNDVTAVFRGCVGLARCSQDDRFDIATGVRVALVRATLQYLGFEWKAPNPDGCAPAGAVGRAQGWVDEQSLLRAATRFVAQNDVYAELTNWGVLRPGDHSRAELLLDAARMVRLRGAE